MAKVLEQIHPLKAPPPSVVLDEPGLGGAIEQRVAQFLGGENIGDTEPQSPYPSKTETASATVEKFILPPLRYVAMHYQCLGMHGYTRPDGKWVIGYLEDRSRPDVKITDFPIDPTNEESSRIGSIIEGKDIDMGYVLCSPRTIIKLLLEGVELKQHHQTNHEEGIFRFSIGGKIVNLLANRDYKDFPKFID